MMRPGLPGLSQHLITLLRTPVGLTQLGPGVSIGRQEMIITLLDTWGPEACLILREVTSERLCFSIVRSSHQDLGPITKLAMEVTRPDVLIHYTQLKYGHSQTVSWKYKVKKWRFQILRAMPRRYLPL